MTNDPSSQHAPRSFSWEAGGEHAAQPASQWHAPAVPELGHVAPPQWSPTAAGGTLPTTALVPGMPRYLAAPHFATGPSYSPALPYMQVPAHVTYVRPAPRHEGLLGIAIGLLVLSLPISGALAMNSMARRAEARAQQAALVAQATPRAATPAATTITEPADDPWATAGDTWADPAADAAPQAIPPAAPRDATARHKLTREQQRRKWEAANRARQQWYARQRQLALQQQQAQRTGATPTATTRPGTATPTRPTPSRPTTTQPRPTAPTTTPQPRPATQPTTATTPVPAPAPAPQVAPTPVEPDTHTHAS